MAANFEGPALEYAPPTNLTLPQFMLDVSHPLRPVRFTNNPWFIDDPTGLEVNFEETRSRVYGLANALAGKFKVGEDDVVCTFTPNDVDYPITMWVIYRLEPLLATSSTKIPQRIQRRGKASYSFHRYILNIAITLY